MPAAILLVTAETKLGSALRAALARLDVAATLAATPVDAVRCLAAEGPGVILVDVAFPGMDALQIVHRARTCRETRSSPIVALVAPGSDTEAWLAAGCTAVLGRDAGAEAIARELAARLSRPA